MTELVSAQNFTDVFVSRPEESTASDDTTSNLEKKASFIKDIMALAAVGVIAFNGTYAINLPKSNDSTQNTVITSPASDDATAVMAFTIPAPKPANLFGDLGQDPALDSYYRKASFFDTSDFAE